MKLYDRNCYWQKKYVIVPEKKFKALQNKAALKTKTEKLFSVGDAGHTVKNLFINVKQKNNS